MPRDTPVPRVLADTPVQTLSPDAPPHPSQNFATDGFANILFRHANHEDMASLASSDLEAIAQSSYEHLTRQRTQAVDVCLIDKDVSRDGHDRQITIIEILNDNMPFLLDLTLSELSEQGYEPKLVAHPILVVHRDQDGHFISLKEDTGLSPVETRPQGDDFSQPGNQVQSKRESFIHIHVDRIDSSECRQKLIDGLNKTFADVRLAVNDWTPMRERLNAVIASYKSNPPPLSQEETIEAIEFINWIASNNFALLGIREYHYPQGQVASDPRILPGLGILADTSLKILRDDSVFVDVTPEVRAFLNSTSSLLITKANVKSRVHRRVHMDYIGIKLFEPEGSLLGELRVVGLFTSNAYTGSPTTIPYLRRKVAQIIDRAGFDKTSYSGRAILNILDTYPRDELFQSDIDTLYDFTLNILQLSERPRVRVLARIDTFNRFVSVLVYIPKDRYDTHVRRRVGDFLAQVFAGRVSAAYPAYPEGPLARTQFIIGRDGGMTPRIAQADLETGVLGIVRT